MRRVLAVGLALCGLLVAGVSMRLVAESLPAPAYRPATFWPLPGLYLVEVVVLVLVIFVTVVAEAPRAFVAAWAAIGALTTFTVLGAMTIGPFIVMSLLALVPATMLGKPEGYSRRLGHAVAFVSGLLAQAGVMFTVIRVMLR
jgi:hypothetical protein